MVKNTLDPVWQAFKIPVRALCNGDYDRYGVGDNRNPTNTNISLTMFTVRLKINLMYKFLE